MNINLTFLFAGILGLMFVLLRINVIIARLKNEVALMDGGKKDLQYVIRAQANFAEYTPFFLLLFYIIENTTYPPNLLLILGSAFTLGRISHAYSFLKVERAGGGIKFRQIGTVITFLTIIIESIICLKIFFT